MRQAKCWALYLQGRDFRSGDLTMRLKHIGIILLLVGGCSSFVAEAQNEKQRETSALSMHATHSIKRYWFTADSTTAVLNEFKQRNIQLLAPLKLPVANQSLQITGIGASGYNSHFLVEHVGSQWHVYVLRHRPQQPVAPLHTTETAIFPCISRCWCWPII